MLFKWNLFCCRRPRSSSSPSMGPDISMLQPEAAAGPTFENVGSIYQRNDDKGSCKVEEETNSSVSRGRKSFSSFAIERGFLKWVLGSQDKDRGLEREREPVHNGRKSVSDSQKIEKKPEPADIVQEAKYVKTINSKDMAEDGIIRGRNPSKKVVDNEAMEEAVSNGKEGVEENSILYWQEPPSFRIYCVHNVSVHGDSNE